MTDEINKAPKADRKSSLDVSAEALHDLASQTVALATEYLEQVSELPVFPETSGGTLTRTLGSDLPVDGEPLERLIEDCRRIFHGSRHNGHPRFFAYVASPANPAGVFADLLASALNSSVTSWRSGPGATEIERLVVRWLGSMVGYGEDTHGLLTSGGSMANLLGILVGLRSRAEGNFAHDGLWRMKPMVMYASEQVHMSIPKAADVLGIGRKQVRAIPTDKRFRIKISELRRVIAEDLESGVEPFCVVASAGTVNTGAVDPLLDVADVAKEFGLWFHIDGAYGALGALDEAKRPLFRGIERADSISLDPHKWLYTPVDCGCILFHNERMVRTAFSANEADYIKVLESTDEESFAFWDYGIELSRRFRALKVWFAIKYYGARRLAAAISDDNALAEYLADSIRRSEDFELLAPVELSICCFRYVPPTLRQRLVAAKPGELAEINRILDELNTRIMLTVQRGGKAYLSNATIRGLFALRMCIVNFRTTRADIDETLRVIRAAAEESTDYTDYIDKNRKR